MVLNINYYLLIFFISFLIFAVATPLASKTALNNNIVDKPGFHKTHFEPKLLLGGLAIFVGFAATIFFFRY